MKTHLGKLIILSQLLLSFLPALSEKKSFVNLFVNIVDEISHENLDSASFQLVMNDSVKVPVDTVYQSQDGKYNIRFSGADGRYTLLSYRDGYDPATLDFLKKSDRYGFIGLGEITLKKTRLQNLDEVTVVATRIKMVMKGDTIVYDASAFDLAEGSMLDALVAQLPGAELKNGQITVNGKRISSLLVNGEDFFSGNPKVALENLPSYTVGHIKVYDREARDAYLRGGKSILDDENLVMDVRLKKKYSYGFIGNASGGYGTGERYAGKLFGLGYRDGLRLSTFANLNNIKDTSSAGSGGEWGAGWGQDGELNLKMGGADYLWTRRDLRLSGNVMLTGENADVATKQSTVAFYDTGDLYGRLSSRQREKKLHLLSDHSLSWSGKNVYVQIDPSVDYLRNNYRMESRQATFTAPVAEDYRGEALDSLFGAGSGRNTSHLLNRTRGSRNGRTDWIIARAKTTTVIKMPGLLDHVRIHAGGDYRHDRDNNASEISQLSGITSGEGWKSLLTDQELGYTSEEWSINTDVSYQWRTRPYSESDYLETVAEPKAAYSHSSLSHDNLLFRLQEETAGESTPPSQMLRGRLPLDLDNTYHSRLSRDDCSPSFSFQFAYAPDYNNATQHQYVAKVSVTDHITGERLHYRKAMRDTLISRVSNTLRPYLELGYARITSGGSTEFVSNYSFSQNTPSILYNLDTYSNPDPMNIYLNNPGLKTSLTHSGGITLNRIWNTTHRSLDASIQYNHTDHAIAQARRYDMETGVSIWRPENVDGNWNTQFRTGYSIPFGKEECFQFNGSTTADYVNSVDYSTTTEVLTLSEVHNLTLGQQASLSLRIRRNSVGIKGGISWQRATSEGGFFPKISALGYNARVDGVVNLVYGWQLASDLNLYARRGYSDNTLNTTDWIWNASISKTFLKGNLILKAEAIDILGQMSQIRTSLNAQGRTETWVNSMPRYAMLHLIYRLNIQPKK